MVDFRAVIENLVDIGFYSVILPFLLVYVVVFGILEKSGIFKNGDDNQVKNINSIIAFVFALFVVASIQTVKYLQSFITSAIVFIIFILVVLILVGFVFGDKYMQLFMDGDKIKKPLAWVIAGVILIVAIVALIVATGVWDTIYDEIDDAVSGDGVVTALVVIGIVAVLYFVTKEDGSKK